jgi:hypothetical protein
MYCIQKDHRLIISLVVWVFLTSCESRKPPTVVEQQPVLSTMKPLPTATVAAQTPVADTLGKGQVSASGDVPVLHVPFEERKTVASGLVVIVKSIRPADTAIIREPSDLKLTFTIRHHNKIIYRDTANDGLMYDYYSMPKTEKLYPIWIPTGSGNGELLVAFNNRPSKELARRFYIRSDQVAKIDTILTFNGPAKDWDKDGKLEYAGFYDFGEEWDDDKGRHRMAYVPTLYYEIRANGLTLDSALTKRKALADYGVFQGFEYTEKPGILVDKLPKGAVALADLIWPHWLAIPL